MPNIGNILKEEITRLARREVRSQVDTTKKATTTHRHEIAALKRQVANLERQITLLLRKSASVRPEVSPEATAKPMRFSAKRLQSQRSRLGLAIQNFSNLAQRHALPRGARSQQPGSIRVNELRN